MSWTCLSSIRIKDGNSVYHTYNLPTVHDGWAETLGETSSSGAYYNISDAFSGTYPFLTTSFNDGETFLYFNDRAILGFNFNLSSQTQISLNYAPAYGQPYTQGVGFYSTNCQKVGFGVIINEATKQARVFLMESGSGYEVVKTGYYTEGSLEALYKSIYSIATAGGAGSGYIGNSLLSNKKMVGYNVPTSSAESTKTESVNTYDANHVPNKPKAGNGHARIKFLRDITRLADLVKTIDISHYQSVNNYDDSNPIDVLSQYFGTDWILVSKQSNGNYFTSFDGDHGVGRSTTSGTGCLTHLPITPIQVRNYKFKATCPGNNSQSRCRITLGYTDNNNHMNYVVSPWLAPGISSGGDWTEFTYALETPVTIEYVVILTMDYQWQFKDFIFNYS